MKAIAPTNQKLRHRLKFWKRRSNSKIRWSRSWYQIKGIARRNTHVKYESLSTNQSKVMTQVKVFEKNVKLKGQRAKVMVSNERSSQKEYTCQI
jgi:hypothetical protein